MYSKIKVKLLFLPLLLILLGMAGGNYNILVPSPKIADRASVTQDSSNKQSVLDTFKYNDQVVVSVFSLHFSSDYILLYQETVKFVTIKVYYFQQFSLFRISFFKILFRNIISPNAP